MPDRTLTERTRPIVSRGGEYVLVLGGGPLGRELAHTLSEEKKVTLVDSDEAIVRQVEESGLNAHCGDPTDVHELQEVDAGEADSAVVTTLSDRQSALATQQLRAQFGIGDVVVLVKDPEVQEAVESIGVETVCMPDRLIPELTEAVERHVQEQE